MCLTSALCCRASLGAEFLGSRYLAAAGMCGPDLQIWQACLTCLLCVADQGMHNCMSCSYSTTSLAWHQRSVSPAPSASPATATRLHSGTASPQLDCRQVVTLVDRVGTDDGCIAPASIDQLSCILYNDNRQLNCLTHTEALIVAK